MLDLKELPDGIVIKVRVQPKASKNELSGLFEDALKLRITAPPVDGAANEAVIKFLAKLFKVTQKQVEISAGHSSRNKTVKISGINFARAQEILGSFM